MKRAYSLGTLTPLHWLETMELHPIAERGHQFSWSNKEEGDNRILTKIDHAIGNLKWLNTYNYASVLYANQLSSDHTPLILNLAEYEHKQNKPFRFFNYMCEHQDFLTVVRDAWWVKMKGAGL